MGSKLTIVSFGAGQDTIYFVHRLLIDSNFYNKHIQGRLLIVGSDTGEEHPHTYEAIERMKVKQRRLNLPLKPTKK